MEVPMLEGRTVQESVLGQVMLVLVNLIDKYEQSGERNEFADKFGIVSMELCHIVLDILQDLGVVGEEN